MSDVFEPELNQDIVSQDSMDTSETESNEDTKPAKKGLVDSVLSMGLFDVMLLLALIFICVATLKMLGVLQIYSEGFPFSGGGFPWSPNI